MLSLSVSIPEVRYEDEGKVWAGTQRLGDNLQLQPALVSNIFVETAE
jgi:hypothetical protein